MRTIGKLTTVVAVVAALGGAALGVASIPDVKRYLKMRAM